MCKKFMAMSAALVLTLSMAACGNSGSETTVPSGSNSPSVTTQPIETTQPTETTQPETSGAPEAAFEELVLVDSENCTVKVTGIEEDGLFGYGIQVFLENRTEKNLMFSVSDVSVNGYMIDPFWATTVASGKKANETITFLSDDFEKNGIEAVTDITFTLNVYDNDDILADDLVEETFTINP